MGSSMFRQWDRQWESPKGRMRFAPQVIGGGHESAGLVTIVGQPRCSVTIGAVIVLATLFHPLTAAPAR